jgi:membrane protein
MAALPIFMIWVYLSWLIVLFGLGVCYAKQNLRTSGRDLRGSEVSRNSFEQVALAILVTLADRFSCGERPLSNEQLAKYLFIPPRLCRSIIQVLLKLGFVTEICTLSGHCQYQLGRSAEDLKVSVILQEMGECGERPLHLHPHPQTLIALETHRQIKELISANFGTITLRDLVMQSRSEAETNLAEA